jgi:hypothetical protein
MCSKYIIYNIIYNNKATKQIYIIEVIQKEKARKQEKYKDNNIKLYTT